MYVIKKRSIGLAILFSIITCGIYGIYWFICLTNDSNHINPEDKTASGGMAFLFTIITCGIYGIYWNYKLGKKVAGGERCIWCFRLSVWLGSITYWRRAK